MSDFVSMENAINIGSRLEPFCDDFLIEKLEVSKLVLHHPQPQEIVMTFDKSWEGSTCGYVTVFKDGDIFKMYYRASDYDIDSKTSTHPQFVCYAESTDGINWTKPALNLFDFEGSKKNNIVYADEKELGTHNFTPFKDTNPAVKDEQKYKALGSGEIDGKRGLFAFVSPDGIKWKLLKKTPVITKGQFDSQNLAFYDKVRNTYFEYHRGWSDGDYKGIRAIMVCVSDDFENWSEPEFLQYIDSPQEHLYTNAIVPYFRAPHIFFGFPKRFIPERQKGSHPVSGVSDALFMSSRDGKLWKRWQNAFIRPGLQPERWINRNNMVAWGLISTKSKLNPQVDEISLFSSEGYYTKGNRLRRFTIRLDGFVSVHASGKNGIFTTKPLIFEGSKLFLNYSTSAAGFIKIEILDVEGKFLKDYSAEIYGDSTEEQIIWNSGKDLRAISGKPVRLKFTMSDADLYSMKFAS
ncbi:MAG: hypothetical protein NC906_00550 [Candidatus Omnitrophica bacterium]|nr:hypothetical protein [Candidatus Omnitrophota bacterium]